MHKACRGPELARCDLLWEHWGGAGLAGHPVTLWPAQPLSLPQQQPLRHIMNRYFRVTYSCDCSTHSDLGTKHYFLLPTLMRCNLHIVQFTHFKDAVWWIWQTYTCATRTLCNQDRERLWVVPGALCSPPASPAPAPEPTLSVSSKMCTHADVTVHMFKFLG